MKISARNQLKGTIMKITPGAVNTEVIIKTAGGEEIVSVITRSSAERMNLAAGKEVFAIIKASEVMIGTE